MTVKKKKASKEKSLPTTCDWNGTCKREAFAEIYPIDSNATLAKGYPVFKQGGWSYLCFRHFIYASLRGDSFAWCEINIDNTTRFQNVVISVLDKIVKFYGLVRKLLHFVRVLKSINKSYDNKFLIGMVK